MLLFACIILICKSLQSVKVCLDLMHRSLKLQLHNYLIVYNLLSVLICYPVRVIHHVTETVFSPCKILDVLLLD